MMNNAMSLTEQFEKFLAKVEWKELTIGEKEALYEATYGALNEDGIPFSVSEEDNGGIVVIRYNDEAELKLARHQLPKFRTWLEETYMGGEMGEAWLLMEEEKEKDDIRKQREMKSEYEIFLDVLSLLKERYSRFSIAQQSPIPYEGGQFMADIVVFDSKDRYKLIIDIKRSISINELTFQRTLGRLIHSYQNTAFILTDGGTAILHHEERRMHEKLSLGQALNKIILTESQEGVKVSLDEIKQCLQEALNVFKRDQYTEGKGEKWTSLSIWFTSLQENDIEYDSQESSYIYLSDDAERYFFKILLGTYNKCDLVKYGSARAIENILQYKTMNMCSIACMNDPQEGIYANDYMEIEPREEDKSNVAFIISGCHGELDDNLTMWRLYGDDAKGVSIKFNIHKEKLNSEFYLAPISYSENEETHFELDIIKQLLTQKHKGDWKFTIKNWHIWKHFFKKHIYSDEKEVRLLYIPKNFDHEKDGRWFNDDKTSIHAEMALFKLTDLNSPFPLTLNKIRLGPKFPAKEINVAQYNQHFRLMKDIFFADRSKALVITSDIKDYR